MSQFLLATAILVASATVYVGKEWRSAFASAFGVKILYLRALVFFLRGGTYKACPYFITERNSAGLSTERERLQAKAQTYSLALIFYLWSKPHYRSGTFANDMVKNLRNVAIPGTGIPLSIIARFKPVAFLFVVFGMPLICVIAGLRLAAEPADRSVPSTSGLPFGLVWPSASDFAEKFRECLLTPRDWHSYWRLNCRLASFHALVSKDATADDFALEDKWKFLTRAEEKGVPVTPFITTPGIVCKHRNEEGGLGYCAFTNAAAGGDWIIQERLSNGGGLEKLLPDNAPLSTLRVITASTAGLPPHLRNSAAGVQVTVTRVDGVTGESVTTTHGAAAAAAAAPIALRSKVTKFVQESDGETSSSDSPASILLMSGESFGVKKTLYSSLGSRAMSRTASETSLASLDDETDVEEEEEDEGMLADDDDDRAVASTAQETDEMDRISAEEAKIREDISALSCVFRAGRQGALTDHVNILFDVDGKTGAVRKGTTNQHWYNLGLAGAMKTTWVSTHDVVDHPDGALGGKPVVGEILPIERIVEAAVKGHARLCPGVPLVGWDVAMTAEHGMLLLEGNFSCNFFRGEFDELKYFQFVDRYFSFCDTQRAL